jgi:hypothetical protein
MLAKVPVGGFVEEVEVLSFFWTCSYYEVVENVKAALA